LKRRNRNLRRRVIDECIVPYLLDSKDACELRSDGSHEHAGGADSAQEALISLYTGSN
jgi:polyphosphate kinase